MVSRMPFMSPVYYANGLMAGHLQQYLEEHPTDVVVAPHLYPAEMITYLKRHSVSCPKLLFIATDYACIPFTEETDCDYYVIPHPCLAHKFTRRGIPADKLMPFGIPVRRAFTRRISKSEARRQLGLPQDAACYLIMGGSMSAGKVKQIVSYHEAHPGMRDDQPRLLPKTRHVSVRQKRRPPGKDRTQAPQASGRHCIYEKTAAGVYQPGCGT